MNGVAKAIVLTVPGVTESNPSLWRGRDFGKMFSVVSQEDDANQLTGKGDSV